MAVAAAFALPATWRATFVNQANAPTGTQRGTPSCALSDNGIVVTCNSYDLGNANATATLSATYTGTVLCKNPAGNVAPGQTQNPTIDTSTLPLVRKNGRPSVPPLSSTTDVSYIETKLMQYTTCPNPTWTMSVQPGSIALVSYIYTLSFTGYQGPYILITGQ